ncbi:MAG TPA: RagB/SusD family nutrient uptake outer membrane protein, partial [Cytophagales bacterium]|nr:RagB/SusD family nutrient uptake outer membrane protein [Cytophagales bacterium]
NDKRIKAFIVGQQYAADGVTKVLDGSYEKGNADTNLNDPDGETVIFTPKVNQFLPNALRQAGARLGKFQFAVGSLPDLDNDFPVFRLGHVLLDKAECLFRKNGYTDATGVALVNQVRARTGMPNYTTTGVAATGGLDPDEFLAERGRELFSEAWRRSDLVRFGKYGKIWFGKPALDPADGHLNLFPIPLSQITATAGTKNPLKQNAGY